MNGTETVPWFPLPPLKCDDKPDDACPSSKEGVGCPFELNWCLTLPENPQLNLDYILKFPLLLSHLWLRHHLYYSITYLKKMNGSISFSDQQEAGLGTVQVNLMLYESPTSSLHNCPSGLLLHCLFFSTRVLSTLPTCF